MSKKIHASGLLRSREKSFKFSVGANQVCVVMSGKLSRGFYWNAFLPWHFQRVQTHAKLNAFLWPELKQEWQMPLILLYWVMTVISWPCSDVNLLTERAGRWHKSSFLFHLQFVHCRVKKGTPSIKRGTRLSFCISPWCVQYSKWCWPPTLESLSSCLYHAGSYEVDTHVQKHKHMHTYA